MLRPLLLATALVLPGAMAAPAFAQSAQTEASEPATLSLTASGEVSIAPDMAVVTAGAVTRGETAAEALRANSRLMNEVFAALDEAGITGNDRQTSNLSVNPVYASQDPNRSRPQSSDREIVGYEARNTVTAVVRDLDSLGQTIDALVESGANELQGVSFSAEDPAEARNEARRRAVAKLNDLRDLYADAAGFTVLGLQSISESGGYSEPMMMRSAGMAMDESTPVAAGEVTVRVTVNASWRIDD